MTLTEVKQYIRVDYTDDDELILFCGENSPRKNQNTRPAG